MIPKIQNGLTWLFFDKNGKLESGERTYPEIIKRYSFYEDGTLESIINFDPITKKKLKQTCYLPDGKGIGCIVEYDPITENELKEIVYHSD